MQKTRLIMAAAAMTLSLTGMADFAHAQSAKAHKAAKGQLASPAQLQREHDRALKAGDAANDPFNPASSNDLNKQQLANAPGSGLRTTDTNSTDASTMGTANATTATGEAVSPTTEAAPPTGDATAGDATTSGEATTPDQATPPAGEATSPTEQPMDPKAQKAPPVLPDNNPPATSDDNGGKTPTTSDKPQAQ